MLRHGFGRTCRRSQTGGLIAARTGQQHVAPSAATDAKSVTRPGVRTPGLGETERFGAIVVSPFMEAARRILRLQMERGDLQEPGERINSPKEFRR